VVAASDAGGDHLAWPELWPTITKSWLLGEASDAVNFPEGAALLCRARGRNAVPSRCEPNASGSANSSRSSERPARRVRAADALDFINGYTVANDYAIREYLENYYRPNARVKNRDATTPIGPWIVDSVDVGDPQSLALSTTVNGAEVQHGSTADMILGVAGLIEYLSEFMTLMPGDMVLTGTPNGVHSSQQVIQWSARSRK